MCNEYKSVKTVFWINITTVKIAVQVYLIWRKGDTGRSLKIKLEIQPTCKMSIVFMQQGWYLQGWIRSFHFKVVCF